MISAEVYSSPFIHSYNDNFEQVDEIIDASAGVVDIQHDSEKHEAVTEENEASYKAPDYEDYANKQPNHYYNFVQNKVRYHPSLFSMHILRSFTYTY